MKRWLIAFVLLAALGVGGVAAWRHEAGQRQVSDLYRRYEHADGIAASYVHNYRVSDTLTLDATILEATTDSGWAELLRAFGLERIYSEMDDSLRHIIETSYSDFTFGYCPKGHPELKMDTVNRDNNEMMVVDMIDRRASLFHTRNYAECQAVTEVSIDAMFRLIDERDPDFKAQREAREHERQAAGE